MSIGALGQSPVATGFRARFADGQDVATYRPQTRADATGAMGAQAPADAPDALDQALSDAFAQGFEAGSRTMRESFETEHAARDRLASAIELLAPAQNGALSSMLSAAVMRLVRQIVGEASVDPDLLRARVEAVAAFVEGEQGRNALRVHPDDIALLDGCELGIEVVADPALSRGSVRLDTSDGWIEDGPDVQLSRLKAMLDGMEGRI